MTQSYPYLRAGCKVDEMTDSEIEDEIAYAVEHGAPEDAWARLPATGGKWRWLTVTDLEASAPKNPWAATQLSAIKEKLAAFEAAS